MVITEASGTRASYVFAAAVGVVGVVVVLTQLPVPAAKTAIGESSVLIAIRASLRLARDRNLVAASIASFLSSVGFSGAIAAFFPLYGDKIGLSEATIGTIFGLLYDDAENVLSFSVSGSCQLRNSLSNNFPRTTPRVETFIPAGRTGWVKFFNQTGAIGLLGAAINLNANAASSAGAFNGGHNLHHLTLNCNMTYTVPVFPPSC